MGSPLIEAKKDLRIDVKSDEARAREVREFGEGREVALELSDVQPGDGFAGIDPIVSRQRLQWQKEMQQYAKRFGTADQALQPAPPPAAPPDPMSLVQGARKILNGMEDKIKARLDMANYVALAEDIKWMIYTIEQNGSRPQLSAEGSKRLSEALEGISKYVHRKDHKLEFIERPMLMMNLHIAKIILDGMTRN